MKAIQDHYPPDFAHCYGCGPANPFGHHLKSYLLDDRTEARFTPDQRYRGGVPDNVYGGMIASLLDCHGTASAAAFAYQEADADAVGLRLALRRRRVDRRAAFGAERLHSLSATLGGRLEENLRLARAKPKRICFDHTVVRNAEPVSV